MKYVALAVSLLVATATPAVIPDLEVEDVPRRVYTAKDLLVKPAVYECGPCKNTCTILNELNDTDNMCLMVCGKMCINSVLDMWLTNPSQIHCTSVLPLCNLALTWSGMHYGRDLGCRTMDFLLAAGTSFLLGKDINSSKDTDT